MALRGMIRSPRTNSDNRAGRQFQHELSRLAPCGSCQSGPNICPSPPTAGNKRVERVRRYLCTSTAKTERADGSAGRVWRSAARLKVKPSPRGPALQVGAFTEPVRSRSRAGRLSASRPVYGLIAEMKSHVRPEVKRQAARRAIIVVPRATIVSFAEMQPHVGSDAHGYTAVPMAWPIVRVVLRYAAAPIVIKAAPAAVRSSRDGWKRS